MPEPSATDQSAQTKEGETLDVPADENEDVFETDDAQPTVDIYVVDPDGEEDPCEVYISLESSAGCVYYDVTPMLRVLGSIMMVTGVLLIIFSIRMNRLFLLVII